MPKGYKIKVTGHSLGAGVACMLGLLLRGGTWQPLTIPKMRTV